MSVTVCRFNFDNAFADLTTPALPTPGRRTVDVDLVLVTTDSMPHVEARGTFCGRDITQTFDPGT